LETRESSRESDFQSLVRASNGFKKDPAGLLTSFHPESAKKSPNLKIEESKTQKPLSEDEKSSESIQSIENQVKVNPKIDLKLLFFDEDRPAWSEENLF
jgi:hypothetical protein